VLQIGKVEYWNSPAGSVNQCHCGINNQRLDYICSEKEFWYSPHQKKVRTGQQTDFSIDDTDVL
jgi:hypothetical protein